MTNAAPSTVHPESAPDAAFSRPTSGPPPGWYDDPTPSAAGSVRWWDGTGWTAYTATKPQPLPGARTRPARVKRHLFLTHERSMVLFALTVVAALIGFMLYPGTAPAHATTTSPRSTSAWPSRPARHSRRRLRGCTST